MDRHGEPPFALPAPLRIVPLVLALCLMLGSTASASASTLFALVDTGELFASTDSGSTWSVRSTLPVSDAAALLAASAASELFLVSRTGTVYRSSDAGAIWNAVGAIAASDVVDVVGRADGALLAMTRSGTVWISTNEGLSFAAQSSLTASDLVSIARGDDGTLLALTKTGTVSRSIDGGDIWSTIAAVPVSDAVAIRASSIGFCLLTDTGLMYSSLDAGETWSAVGTVSQVGMRGLVEDAGDIIAIHRTGLTARSSDGANWTWVGTVNQVEVVAVANDVPQTAGVPEGEGETSRLVLSSPRPNPVRAGSTVQVEFKLPAGGDVTLSVYNVQGGRVAVRPRQRFPIGASVANWEVPLLTAGVYLLKLATSGREWAVTRLVIVD